MIEHEKHERFIAIYLQEHYLGEKAEVKLMETTNKEVVLQYIAKSSPLCKKAQIKMVERKDAQELVKAYTQLHYLDDEAQFRMFELSQGV